MLRTIAAAAFAAALSLPAGAGDIASSVDRADLTERERTSLDLYLSPEDAHAALQANPDIVFIDVRSPIEVEFVGIAEGTDANVPFAVKTMDYEPESEVYDWTPNESFVRDVDAILAREGKTRDDPVFIQCRSGARSTKAVRKLIAAGYTEVYNLVEGFEGGKHPETGHRTVAGWRNAGLPWRYGIAPEQAWTPGS